MFSDSAVLFTASGRTALLFGVFLLTGAAVSTWLAPMRAIARAMRWAALLLLVGVALQATGQLIAFDAFAADADPLADTVAIIAGTSWGRMRIWLVAFAMLALSASWLRERAVDYAARLVAIAVLLLLPLLGHAASAQPAWFALSLGAAHAAAASVWIGTLMLLAPSWWNDVQATVPLLPRYGRVALFSAPLTMLTGAVTAWMRLENIGQLLSTGYGRLLLVKSLSVIVVLALGALHHRRLTRAPQLQSADIQHTRRSLQAEVVLAVIVLLLTGWLGESAPPTLD